MIRAVRTFRVLPSGIRYFLRLPLVALEIIYTEGWAAFRIEFKYWLRSFATGEDKRRFSTRRSASTVTHEIAIFGKKADYIPEIVGMLEKGHQPIVSGKESSLDVFVPIHNAYDDLLKCLYSLFSCQDIYRVILLDDFSTDTKVKDLLQTLKLHEREGFRIETNPKNLGYVKTANKGMRMANNDVILLNTDTVVTVGWARKMRACAYSDDRIATVTPFTNNGRMCSVPEFLENNKIPEGFTVGSFAECVENASSNRYPELVTAVGFCMYIRRNVIDEIGYFDEANFATGYGEEVDFSFRASCKGYKNVLCDNTFVFHRGRASFLDTQDTVMKRHHRVLRKKYPELWAAVRLFERSNPLKSIHDRLISEMKTRGFRRNRG